MWQSVSRLLSEYLGETYTITEKEELSGGDIHHARRVSNGKKEVFIKYDTRDILPIFNAEFDQLTALAKSGTVRVPEVYGVGYDRDFSFLLLEYLPLKPLDAHHAYCLGQQLARLHQWSDQPQFGLDFDSDLTTTPQPNRWQRYWNVFFAEQRIGWQLQLAAEKGLNYGDIDTIIDIVSHRLKSHHPQPSLLHGDLWPTNCGVSAVGPIIFDPACYWGDRECDLAMLPLYPDLPPQIYDGYQSVWPLPASFIDRQPLYQLYYLLNRANLFGDEHINVAQQAVTQLFGDEL
ncbi:fructosamine kinase family protein [Jinshanibacter sp. LJY008]|uniref:Fructosamine kinase family protein n=1 Tax=Limnobaculum eriocheiris TaxID=2897391 RepID=A0A9X1MXJ9_9GAMM|nr:fructosamine kinase family protein [Limnobaculum eriocheiris]MCD1126744.1 fructosamine kinase family protein [Limnobaculum eriocheiris]